MATYIVFIIIGVIFTVLGFWAGRHSDYVRHLLCGACLAWIGLIFVFFGIWCIVVNDTTYYLEAEPIAYNTNTTIFSTPNGYYTANAIYDEDTMYLLTMDDMGTNDTEDDKILVVWKCDEGSVG